MTINKCGHCKRYTTQDLKWMMSEYAEDNSLFSEEDNTLKTMKRILWRDLSEADRRIILIYADSASLRKTAATLNLSVGTVIQRIHKIQNMFKEKMYK